MKKWTLVDRALMPDGVAITLHEQDGTYSIHADSVQLMSTRVHGSEEKLAELACAHLKGVAGARVLIGGLGFGFTLQAALATLAVDATVVVVEILAAVIAWNRNASFPLAAVAMTDPRVTVVHQDVVQAVRQARNGFDSIILDVDNGPAAVSTAGNSKLYDPAGLQSIRASLRPGGCVAFWSAGAHPAFERAMTRAGFTVEVRRVRSHGHSGGRHTFFLGRVGC